MSKIMLDSKLVVLVILIICSSVSSAFPVNSPDWTNVEIKFINKSTRQSVYPNEYIASVETRNNYELGKLAALRFIEWLQDNPNSVVGFTSCGTPEYFVKFLSFYRNNWSDEKVQEELKQYGINLEHFPDTSNLKLVQLEELFPIHEMHFKKLTNFTIRHYAKVLNIKSENLYLIEPEKQGILAEKGINVIFMNGRVDLSISSMKATSQMEIWQQMAIAELKKYCEDYDKKIAKLGGIDFFIASMGYDGQLGFIEPETPFTEGTHIIPVDYKTAAQSAKDLGGIDYIRGKIAISAGYKTLTLNPNAVMIIMANGNGLAESVMDSVENESNELYPVTFLQKYPNSRIYMTNGAASKLEDRQTEDLNFKSKHGWMQKHVEEVIIYVSLEEEKPILSLSQDDLGKYARGKLLLENPPKPLNTLLKETHDNLVKKIETGAKFMYTKGGKAMHTFPHHDDVVLGYYPLLEQMMNRWKNQFVNFTSGYNSVSDTYLLNILNDGGDWWLDKEKDEIIKNDYRKILEKYQKLFDKRDFNGIADLDTILSLRCVVKAFDIKEINELKHIIRWLKDDYFRNRSPGELDILQVNRIKMLLRESEGDRIMHLHNVPNSNVINLHSKFYSGREFMRTPRYHLDVEPFAKVYNAFKPDALMVLEDPDSPPSSTNYRVLQIIAQMLRSDINWKNEKLDIYGYRSVWFRYRLTDFDAPNIFVPVSSETLVSQSILYNTCFPSQKKSQFPSPNYGGDYAASMDSILRKQFLDLRVLLGSDFFARHPTREIREAAGFLFLTKMGLNEFFRKAHDLQPYIELEDAYINNSN